MNDRLVLEFAIAGKPQPQGSATAYVLWKERKGRNKWAWVPLRRRDGSIAVNVTSDNDELKKWREDVATIVRAELAGKGVRVHPDDDPQAFPIEGAGFTIEYVSHFKRREADWGTGANAGTLKEHAEARPVREPRGGGVPDVDKLLRAVLDALAGVVWADDSQVTDGITRKRFAVPTVDGDAIRAEARIWINGVQTAADLPEDERVRFVAPPKGQEALPVG